YCFDADMGYILPKNAASIKPRAVQPLWKSSISNTKWSGARDLNPGPHGPEPCALPNCASPRLEVILSGHSLRRSSRGGGGPVAERTFIGMCSTSATLGLR